MSSACSGTIAASWPTRSAAPSSPFLHVWQFAVGSQSFGYLVLMIQYLVPGLVLAWAYDRAGNLWGPILIHMSVNALSVWLG